MSEDLDPPWKRAGGYPFDDWVRCLRLATKRRVEAAHALTDYVARTEAISPETVHETRRLREAEDEAIRIRNAVLSGDPRAVGDLFGEILLDEQPDRG